MAALAAALALLQNNALAFGGDAHNALTAKLLRELGFSDSAASQIGAANEFIDNKEADSSPTHFDSESFEAGSALIRTRLHGAAVYLANGDVKNARAVFGYLTHTAQDFYAHTNYVEYMPGKTIDLLRLTNPSPAVSCSRDNKKSGLTSGYYPDASAPANKCSHSTLNKDSGDLNVRRFRAMRYAEDETAHMFTLLKQELSTLTDGKPETASLLAAFKGEPDTVQTANTDAAAAAVEVSPSPQKKGLNMTAAFTSGQYCEKYRVDIMDLTGKIVTVDSPGNPAGAEHLYNGPMGKGEKRTVSFRTENLASGIYFLRAEYENCADNVRGSKIFQFSISD